MNDVIKGKVKWFNDAKGFGFIEHQKGDVFVHFSSIETPGFKTLKNGEEVDYVLEDGDKGLHAKNVQRINIPAEEATQKSAAAKPARSGLAAQIEVERIPDSSSHEDDDSNMNEIEPTNAPQQKSPSTISKKL